MDSTVNSIAPLKNTNGTQLLKEMLNVGKSPSSHSSPTAGIITNSSSDSLPLVNSGSPNINGNHGPIIDLSDPDDKICNSEPEKNQDKCRIAEMISSSLQKIVLQGSDEDYNYPIYSKEVNIISSTVSNSKLSTQGSSKVKITPVVDFPWENKYYVGHLVAAHKEGIYIAYTLKGKSGGAVRIMHRKLGQRVLLKGFMGAIKDISFAHLTKKILIACVDEFGNLYIHEILENNTTLRYDLILQVDRRENVKPSDYHRVIWCPYIPDDPGAEDEDIAQLLVMTHEEKAEIWNIDVVLKNYTKSRLFVNEIKTGYQSTSSHDKHITDAMLSPDGSALATVSEDGEIKFFQVYLYDTPSAARCLHHWKPHGGKPVSHLFFLDNHKNCNPDIQFWKYAITGCDHNSELKLWSCESWTCLQTIRFLPSPMDNIKPCLQMCLDLSGSFLVMSDINRTVLYVLQICQDSIVTGGSIHFTGISEFILTHPMLSFAVLDAGIKKETKLQTENIDFLIGDFSRPEEEENKDGDHSSLSILVRLYSVHPKSLQELEILFQTDSSMNFSSTASVRSNLSHDDLIFRDGLSDISVETSTSEAEVTQPEDLLSKPLTAKEKLPLAEVLLTPDSFKSTINSPRHIESLNLEVPRSSCTSTSSFTQITTLNECITTPHSSVEISDDSPPTCSSLSSSSSQDANDPNVASPSRTIQNKSSSDFSGINNCNSSTSDLPMYQPVATSETFEEILHQQQQRRHLLSTSSSPSLEVSEILSTLEDNGDQNKPDVSHSWSGELNQEKPVPLAENTRHDYDLKIWPIAPDISSDAQRPTTESRPSFDDSTPCFFSRETSDEEVIEEADASEPDLTGRKNELSTENKQLPSDGTMTISSDLVTDIVNALHYQQKEIVDLKNEVKQQRRLTVTVQSLITKLDKLEGAIISRIERAFMQHNQVANQKLNDALKQRQNQEKNMHDQLLTSLTQAVNNTLSVKLEKTLKSEIITNILPGLTKLIEPIKESLLTELSQKLTATDAIMKDNIGKLVRSRTTIEAIGQAAAGVLQGPIQVSYRDAFQNTVPVFEKACQNMFQQINDAFRKGTCEYIQQLENHLDSRRKQIQEVRDPVLAHLQNVTDSLQTTTDQLTKSLTSNIHQQFSQHLQDALNRLQETLITKVRELVKDEITIAMKDQQTVIGDSVLNAMRSGAVTPATSTPVDPQLQQAHILHLLRQGQLNAAFQQALSAADLNLVMFVCETVNPSQVFNQTPCPLQQAVLLSLIQQLSAELTNNIELKHKYLEEAIMNLDTANPITKEHMPSILTSLVQKLTTYIQLHPTDKITRNMKMLLMAAQSLLK